jgi:hypothetical protein
VPWAEFHMAFPGHHIPAGLMAHKLQEFLHLQQGSSSVYEYSKKFNHLSVWLLPRRYRQEEDVTSLLGAQPCAA